MKGLLVVLFLAAEPVQAEEPALRIVEPLAGASLTGRAALRAELEPPAAADSLLRFSFTSDGVTLCRRSAPPFECRFDAGALPAARTLVASALFKDGRRLTAQVRTGGAVALAQVEVDVVQLAVNVTDGRGRGLPGLAVSEFQVSEDAVPQRLEHFLGPDAPRELVVAIDISASMAPAMPRVRRAVRVFLASLRPTDHVTLLAFNDSVFTAAARDVDPALRLAAAARLAAWGGTSLYDVVLRALDLLDQQRGRKALVVFTDGHDRSSMATLADVERRSETNPVPLYFVAQGSGSGTPELQRILERLARTSGGRAFFQDGPEQLETAFSEILSDFDSQYLLGYTSLNAKRDGAWRRIGVSAGQGRQVRAREGYRAVAARK